MGSVNLGGHTPSDYRQFCYPPDVTWLLKYELRCSVNCFLCENKNECSLNTKDSKLVKITYLNFSNSTVSCFGNEYWGLVSYASVSNLSKVFHI